MQLCELIISVCLLADQYSYLHLYTHHSHTTPIDTVATSGPNTSTNVANKEVLTTTYFMFLPMKWYKMLLPMKWYRMFLPMKWYKMLLPMKWYRVFLPMKWYRMFLLMKYRGDSITSTCISQLLHTMLKL